MKVTGKLQGASISLDGKLVIQLEVNERTKALEEIEGLKELEKLDIDIKKYRNKRSLNANAYMWQLLDKMTVPTQMARWDLYLYYLSQSGVFVDMAIKAEAYPTLVEQFRYTEVLDSWAEGDQGYKTVRCTFGSSTYNSHEMAKLLDRVTEDAKAMGIDVLTEDDYKAMLSAWEGAKADGKRY